MEEVVYTRRKGNVEKTRIISHDIISETTLFNSPQLQRLRQEALVYSRITSHFCEIYLTPHVGEYPRAFVFENRYIFHGTFRSLIFEDYQILEPFLYSTMFAYSARVRIRIAILMQLCPSREKLMR